MKKIFLCVYFALFSAHIVSAQYVDCPEIELPNGLDSVISVTPMPCSYIPLEFENILPLWSHLTIDSTIIGYNDSCGLYQKFYPDGMEHLSFDGGSFVNGDYLYALTMSEIDREASGVIVDKVDLITGELIWQIKHDVRTEPYREGVIKAEVIDDKFILYCVREDIADSLSTSFTKFNGRSGIYCKRVYDLESGQLIDYYTPQDSDTLNAKLFWYNENYILDNRIEVYGDIVGFTAGKGVYLTKTTIDTFGHLISGPDTIYTGRFSDRSIFDRVFSRCGPQFALTEEGHHLYIEQYAPLPGVDLSFEAILTEFDEDFNEIRSVDLMTLGLGEFTQLVLSQVTDDYIMVTGCKGFNSACSFCDPFFLYFDREFNLLYNLDPDNNGHDIRVHQTFNIIRQDNNNYYIPYQQFNDVGQSKMLIYKSDENEEIELLKELTIKQTEWAGFPEVFLRLDNGDFLMKITHSCLIDGDKGSWHPEWFRFAAEDIELLSDVSDISDQLPDIVLSPNPVSDILSIKSEVLLQGRLYIHDIHGRLHSSQEISRAYQHDVDVSTLGQGSYMMILEDDNGRRVIKRFVKM
jgi:hypothetical protein